MGEEDAAPVGVVHFAFPEKPIDATLFSVDKYGVVLITISTIREILLSITDMRK